MQMFAGIFKKYQLKVAIEYSNHNSCDDVMNCDGAIAGCGKYIVFTIR